MIDKNRNKSVALFILISAWLWEFAVNIWYTAKYFIVFDINSDYAGDAVFAKHLADSGKFIFSPDWYPTTELYVIHHQLIMTPLFRILKDYNKAWIATSIVAFILLSAAVFWFMKTIGSSEMRSLLAVVLFVNPIMKFQMSFSVWFHGYLFYYLLAFIIMGEIFRCYSNESGISNKDIIIIFIFSFLSGLCGIRMFMVIYGPIVLTLFIDSYNKEITSLRTAFAKIIAASFAAAMVGFGIHSLYLVPKYGNGALLGIGVTLNKSRIVNENIMSIPRIVIEGLNIDFLGTNSILYAGVIAVELCLWIVIIINNIGLIVRRDVNRTTRLIAVFAVACVAVNLAFMVMTQSNEEILLRYRYFSLSTFIQIPLFAMSVKRESPIRVKDCFNFAIALMAILIIPVWQLDKIKQYGADPVSWRQPYIEFLTDNGYKFGISTYWNADTSIFASNGQVQVAPVNNDEDYTFFAWNTQRSFENRTPEFILLTIDEYNERSRYLHDDTILYKDDDVVILEFT